MSEPFSLGVNYWPRRKAMYWWSDFDAGEVREEFALIGELGMTMVRIFLLWEDFQPTPERVASAPLGHLRTVCDIAAEQGLGLNVTFFTGHMSGPNWSPPWLLGGPLDPKVRQVISGGRAVASGYRNPYHDPVALDAERLLLRTVVGELHDHPAVAVWNLGNEPDLFAWPNDAASGRAWTREMTALIRELDGRPVTCGLHIHDLLTDTGLRANDVFGETDLAVMHAYPMYQSWARGPLDPDVVPFSCALTTALCGKPTLMEEWGGCTAPLGQPSQTWAWNSYGKPREQFMASEEAMDAYVAAVLPRLQAVGATGAVMWCFADYAETLWDRPPCDEARHERYFGLVRPDGSLKPHAATLQRFAATQPLVQPVPPNLLPAVEPEEFYREPRANTIALYEQFRLE